MGHEWIKVNEDEVRCIDCDARYGTTKPCVTHIPPRTPDGHLEMDYEDQTYYEE